MRDKPDMRKDATKVIRALLDKDNRRKRSAASKAALSEDEVKQKIVLTEDEIKAWNQIAAGKPMRNSTAVLTAIKMKMEYTVSKPAQKVDADSKVTVEVVTLGPEPKEIEVVPTPEEPDAKQE